MSHLEKRPEITADEAIIKYINGLTVIIFIVRP